MPSHVVQRGECLSSIARRYGFSADTIWSHPDNKALHDQRKSPNVLYEGDVLFIPDIDPKQVKVASNATHTFVIKTDLVELRLRLLAGGKPVKNVEYTLSIDGVEVEPKKAKKTDGKGMIVSPFSALTNEGVVKVAALGTTYELKFGHLNPISTISGVKARLRQLGYLLGSEDDLESEDDEVDPMFKIAVWLFQNNHGLVATGEINKTTESEIERQYGT